jgi:hypothetical protein
MLSALNFILCYVMYQVSVVKILVYAPCCEFLLREKIIHSLSFTTLKSQCLKF